MNSWLLLRRLRGPAFLILVGITALLNQWGILSFGRSWPLYLILAGILGLAERWVIASAPPVAPVYPSAYPYGAAPAYQPYPPQPPSTALQPATADPLADPDRRS